MLGNRRVAQLIQAKRLTPEGKIIGLQRKLTVGAADDQYEQEADRVARQVMNIPDAVAAASMQRALSSEEDRIRRCKPSRWLPQSPRCAAANGESNEESEDKEQPVQAKALHARRAERPCSDSPKLRRRKPNRSRPNLLDHWPTASRLEPMSKRRSA